MPYYHVDCGGIIGLWTRKCHKCGNKWPFGVLFKYPYPEDMFFQKTKRKSLIGKGETSYAKWADSAPPGTAEFASHLPNWPRWARILSLVVVILLVALIVFLIRK